MHWIVAAPFIHDKNQQWLIPFVDGSHSFTTVLARYNHDRSRDRTSLMQWKDYFVHGYLACRTAFESGQPVGIITVFPQLALAVGLQKRVLGRKLPIVAAVFNLGLVYGGIKGQFARFGLKQVDIFLVHSRREAEVYSEWLRLPIDRFHFIPLQRPVFDIDQDEDENSPFVLAMGSAHRDYKLFLSVIRSLGYPTIIVAGEHALRGLCIPSNVKVLSNLTITECHSLVQRARVNVVPIDNRMTASGQVTLLDAMMFGKAVVATSTVGTVDYVNNGVTAQLVNPNDADDMENKIHDLWIDKDKRNKIGVAARQYVIENLSDQAAGHSLSIFLDQIN